jgi:hypothetical protein
MKKTSANDPSSEVAKVGRYVCNRDHRVLSNGTLPKKKFK